MLLDPAAVDKLKAVLKVALLGFVQQAVQHGYSALLEVIIQQSLLLVDNLVTAILVAQCAIAAAELVIMQTFLLPVL